MSLLDDVMSRVNKRLDGRVPKEAQVKNLADIIGNDTYLSTGLISLDGLLNGGWAEGKPNLIWGPKQAGKTPLVLQTVRSVLDTEDGTVLIQDNEHALTQYTVDLGNFDPSRVLAAQPYSLEQTIWTIRDFSIVARAAIPTGKLLAIWDSYSCASTESAIERNADGKGATVSDEAKIFSSMFKHLLPVLSHNKVTLLIITHARQSLELNKANKTMGKVFRPHGPEALFHHSPVIIKMAPSFSKVEKGILETHVRVEVERAKIAKPRQQCEYLITDAGFDEMDAVAEFLIEKGIIESRGAWLYSGDLKWNGRPALAEWMKSSSENYAVVRDLALGHSKPSFIIDKPIVEDVIT